MYFLPKQEDPKTLGIKELIENYKRVEVEIVRSIINNFQEILKILPANQWLPRDPFFHQELQNVHFWYNQWYKDQIEGDLIQMPSLQIRHLLIS